MNQKEFLKLVTELAKERGLTVTQPVVKELLDVIEETIDKAILDGNTVKAFGVKFEQVKKEAKSGTTMLGGEAKEWHKPAHLAPKASYLPSKRKSLEKEI